MTNKICVYAICKNESQFVEKWYESMKEADEIVVVDTGSTDDTVERLRACGVRVFEKTWSPWRFDEPRNYALDMATDECNIFISTDLDEVLEPGWSIPLKEKWIDKVHTRAQYKYAWSHTENGDPARIFYYDKIHSREWRWSYPVHELLTRNGDCSYSDNETLNLFNEIYLHHYPDQTKSRGSYLPLLELRVKENPNDDSYGKLYLAHEYYYRGYYEKCVNFIKENLIPNNTLYSNLELANIYVFMGDAYAAMGMDTAAVGAYSQAQVIDPTYRESYLRLAAAANKRQEYYLAIGLIKECFDKTVRYYNWLEQDDSWNSSPYDILSISYFYIKDYDKAYANIKKAINFSSLKDDDRLLLNLKFIEKEYFNKEVNNG